MKAALIAPLVVVSIVVAFALPALAVPRLEILTPESTLRNGAIDSVNFPFAYLELGKKRGMTRYSVDGSESPWGAMRSDFYVVHRGTSEEPVSWQDEDPVASNLYFHLNRVVKFFLELEKRWGKKIYYETEKLPFVVRYDVPYRYSMTKKFSKHPAGNSARTVPAGKIAPPFGILFDEEVWFESPRRIYKPKWMLFSMIPGLRDTFLGTKQAPRNLAWVPSVIYHEWSHLLTKRYLGLDHHTILNESLAEYWAIAVSEQPYTGKLRGVTHWTYRRYRYNRRPRPLPKDAEEKCDPTLGKKVPGYCYHRIPRMLWGLRQDLAPEVSADEFDLLVWELTARLHPEVSLAGFREIGLQLARERLQGRAKERWSAEFRRVLAK